MHPQIEIYGARTHNLKNINVSIPHYCLTVITGLSGSGKSSLAFDTLFMEGQRRYIDTFSPYVRSFLGGNMNRPDVDRIIGLSPVISISQKTTRYGLRSTVGTVTEIYDYLRLLFARIGEAYSYLSGERMVKYTEEQLVELIMSRFNGQKIYFLAPLIKNRKGHYRELFENFGKKGFLNVRIDGELREIVEGLRLDRFKVHSIEVVVDKLLIEKKDKERVKNSVHIALSHGNGAIMIWELKSGNFWHLSIRLMCPVTGLSYRDPDPYNFSFNSMYGACQKCKGIGEIYEISKNLVIPHPEQNIYEGGIIPLGKYKNIHLFNQIETILKKYKVDLYTSIKDIPEKAIDDILYGSFKSPEVSPINTSPYPSSHSSSNHMLYDLPFEGVYKYIFKLGKSSCSSVQWWLRKFMKVSLCPECNGKRLNKEALNYRIHGKTISDLTAMDISILFEWINTVEVYLTWKQKQIAKEILKEIRTRIEFLLNVGLHYLTLDRSTISLSGGESQRIRLAAQIGSQLVNVLYILDEPSIGLHPRDNLRLIKSLKYLKNIGNSVVVIEHDKDMMKQSDYVIDLGPGAGEMGGEVVFAGTFEKLLKTDTITASYLNGKYSIPILKRRKGSGKNIILSGATGNNLKNVTVTFPLGKLICITGVSGSGKSTLINETLQPIISQKLYRSLQNPLSYSKIEGLEYVDKIVNVDQSPIGKTSRSNPITYTGIFSDIRFLFTELPESRMRGYKPGRFSFNIKEGCCESCKGNGYKTIEMNFLPSVYILCECCQGKRYDPATLEIKYKGKSIADVLNMTIHQAVEFFKNIPSIYSKLKVLQKVGLGYIRLGQSSITLSGGENQRIKLAGELSKKGTGKTLYILDEPTTGLHFEDIKMLLNIINCLIDKGNTMIIIEHNMDIIKSADYIIDLGLEGGENGGKILFEGTPEQMLLSNIGYTAQFLQKEFMNLEYDV